MDDTALPFVAGVLAIIIGLAGIVTPGDDARYGLLLTGNLADRPTYGTLDRWYYANDTEELFYDNSTGWTEIPLGGAGSDYDIYGKVKTGTHGDRPAASISDRWYFETDTEQMFYDTGAAWVEIPLGDASEHDAIKIKGVTVDNASIADTKILKYNSTSGNLEYEDDEEGEGGDGGGSWLVANMYHTIHTATYGTRYTVLSYPYVTTVEANVQFPLPSGTFKSMTIYCRSNTYNGGFNYTLRVNGVTKSALTLSFGGGETGIKTVTADVAISNEDLCNLIFIEEASSGLVYTSHSFVFEVA